VQLNKKACYGRLEQFTTLLFVFLNQNIVKKIIYIYLLLLLSSCSITLDLYPAKGPLSNLIPIKVIKAKATNVTSNSGRCFLTLPDGEYCEGRWSSTAGVKGSTNNYSLLLDYGQELGLSPRGNENRGYAILLGTKGTSIEIEFLTGAGTAHGFGIAKDNHGNLFRVLF